MHDDGDADGARQRFKGGGDAFYAKVLKPLLQFTGRSCVKYSEDAKVRDAAVSPSQIAAAGARMALQLARECHATLIFSKKTIEHAFQLAVKDADLHLKVEQYGSQWVLVNTRRLFNLFSHVSSACSRSSPPKWVSSLPWKTAASGPGAAQCDASYVTGWDTWLNTAWRAPVVKNKATTVKEPCNG